LTYEGVKVFSLTFAPLNAETTAHIEDDSIRFDEIQQTLTINLEKPIALGTLRVSIQGFQISSENGPSQSTIFSLHQGTKEFVVQNIENVGWISVPIYQFDRGDITLTFQNFATLEGNMVPYDVIIDGLEVFDRSL
jgi:hypothetical protein